ncbi:hypothetical protein D3C75_777420 [compost metagenome]
MDHPVQPFDLAADNIHPHTASGHLAHLSGSGEAGPEDQVDGVLVRQMGCLLLRHNPFLQGRFQNSLRTDSAAVILNGNNHLVVLMVGV